MNALQAVVSTYYLKVKFPTCYVVKEIREDQALARHCYNIALQDGRQADPCPVHRLDAHDDLSKKRGKPINDLVEVLLKDGNEEHTIKISLNLKEEVRKLLVTFLQRNADVFA